MYVNAPRYLLRKYCILKLMEDVPKGTALEIGCGAGDFCETLSKMGFKVKGIDFSQEAIALCNMRLKNAVNKENLRFACEDYTQITETFNTIFMFEVLEHIQDDKNAVKTIKHKLKPEGYFILSVPAHKNDFGPSDEYVGHFRRYDKNDIINLLREHSFDVLRVWSYGVPLANITDFIRNLIHSQNKIASKEEGSKQSGINRKIEARFRFILNDFFLYPFYLLQMLFIHSDLGTGYIIKAKLPKQ